MIGAKYIFKTARILIVGIIHAFLADGVQASDFNKLDEAIPGVFVSRLSPVFDFDGNSCLPSAGISRSGEQNQGLAIGGRITGECRSPDFLNTSNTFHRYTCVSQGGSSYCGHVFALYFEKDQRRHWIDWIGHRHDWEYAMVWTKNGVITHGSASAHHTVITRSASDILFENGHMKFVYYKDEGHGGTHAMRFASRNDKRAKNPYRRFVTPALVSWDTLHGDSLDNQAMKDRLNSFDYGKAVLPCTDTTFYYKLNRFKPPDYPPFYSPLANAGSGLIKWRPGDTSSDCSDTCLAEGTYPVSSGKTPENTFNYVCSTNYGRRGMRTGFNRQGQVECVVGSAGDAHREKNKSCLCSAVPEDDWDMQVGRNGSVAGWTWEWSEPPRNCLQVCEDYGWTSMVSGDYIGGDNNGKLFNVCRVHYKDWENRAGYNLEGETSCVAGTGGSTVIRDNQKECFCVEKFPSTVNRAWGKCLNLQDSINYNGGTPNVWDCTTHPDQEWMFNVIAPEP